MDPHLFILPDAIVYGATSFSSGGTRRHCGVILLSLGGDPVVVRAGAATVRGEAVLVAPGVARSVQAADGEYLSIQIEPQHGLYRSLLRLRERGDGVLALSVPMLRRAPIPDIVAAVTRSVEAILPSEPWGDRRIQAIVDQLAGTPPTDYAFDAVLKASGLSASRFSHVFTATAGVPLRSFMLWRKTSEALRQIGAGQTLTAVAHQAGFADSAHLAKTFQATLGLAPSQIAAARIAQL